jgi:type III restriction enzyme
VQDSLRKALKDGTLVLPEEFAPRRPRLPRSCASWRAAGDQERRRAQAGAPRAGGAAQPEFKALWDRIKHKTTYRVQFDNEADRGLHQGVAAAPADPKTRLQWRKADIAIGKAASKATKRRARRPWSLDETDIELPDLLTDLQDRPSSPAAASYRILTGSGRLDDFKRNPQQFIELAAEAINRCKRLAWWTASSTSGWATSTTTRRSCSSRRS